MGEINIDLKGFFGMKGDSFSTINYGYARAISDAIAYLANILPSVIKLDHDLHVKGSKPKSNFGKD